MTVIAQLKDGRTMASASIDARTFITPGSIGYITATVSELRQVEKVLGINLTSNPATTVSPHSGPYINGNVVGLSVYVAATPGASSTGTSVGGEVEAVGF